MIAAALETIDIRSGTRRRSPRRRLRLNVATQVGDAPAQQVLVHDISISGLLLESTAPLDDESITVELPEAPATTAQVVWSSGHFYGCRFDAPIPTSAVSAALLQSPVERPIPAPTIETAPEPEAAETPASPYDLPYAVERGWLPTGARIQIVVAVSVLLWYLIFKLTGLS